MCRAVPRSRAAAGGRRVARGWRALYRTGYCAGPRGRSRFRDLRFAKTVPSATATPRGLNLIIPMIRTALALFALVTSACATAPNATLVPLTSAAADSAQALALFRENIDAIHKRDRARYIATYLQSPRLARNGTGGLELGFDSWPGRTSTSWPDTLMARDLTVVPLAAGVVYGSYRYDVRYGDSVSTGVSERVFVKTPAGWRIAVTSAFGSPLVFSPRP